jgi:subtilisin-like proprotein convertase family protein
MRKTLLVTVVTGLLFAATAASAQTFTTASPPAAIPDNSAGTITACQTVVVPAGTGNITDLNVSVAATHTWVGDLTYRLQSPGNASTLMLMNRPARNITGTGSPANLAQATPLVFDDAAASGRSAETAGQNPVGTNCTSTSTVGTDCPPDNFIPAPDATDTPIAGVGTNLAQFNGTLADGTWTLCAADSASLDTGTLQSFSLIITAAGGATPPQFAYTPAAGSTVTATGGGAVGSTGTLTITPSIGTAGTGTGAAATTTLTCTAPTAPFSGFGQSVTAVGNGAISGGPLTGSCTLGAAAATQTLTCNENRGGTANARTWTLSCPAGTLTPLTSTPASGSSIALPAQVIGAPATTASIAFQNPNASPVTVTCTAPAATQFTVNPLTINVPASGNASTTVTYTSAAIGSFSGSLTCTAGAQTFTYTLNGSTVGQVQAVDTLGNLAKLLMLLAVLGVGLVAVRRH